MKFKKMMLSAACALLLAVGCAVGAAADSAAPRLELQETGAENQYSLTFRNWSSRFYGVEFDLVIDQPNADVEMTWADQEDSSFRKLESSQADGKTLLKVYYTSRTPISGSDSARIGEITLKKVSGTPQFSSSGKLTLADDSAQKMEFSDMGVSLVTRPSVTPPANDNQAGGSTGSNTGSTGGTGQAGAQAPGSDASVPMLGWDDVKDGVSTGQDGKKHVTVSLEKNPRLSVEILQKLKEEKIAATFSYGAYQWEIDGASIQELPPNRRFYNLSVQKLALKNLSAAVEHSDILQFETAFKGALGFTATLVYPVGAQYAGETVYVSSYNERNGTLSRLTQAQVDANGLVHISLTSLDKQVITRQDFWSEQDASPLLVPGLDSEEMGKLEQQEDDALAQQEAQNSEALEASEAQGQQHDKNGLGALHIALIVGAVVVLAAAGIAVYLRARSAKHRKVWEKDSQ